MAYYSSASNVDLFGGWLFFIFIFYLKIFGPLLPKNFKIFKTVPGKLAATHTEDGHKQDT